MKALKVLNYIYFELNKNNTKGVWIEPKIIKEAIDELENIKNMTHSNCHTTTDTSSKDCCLSLEKRIKHIENTLEQIFRSSAYSKDALNKKIIQCGITSNQNNKDKNHESNRVIKRL